MISIRRIYSGTLARDAEAIRQVQEIYQQNYPSASSHADRIAAMLDRPSAFRHRTILLVSQTADREVTGFSLISHFPELKSAFLEFITFRLGTKSQRLRSALYEAGRDMLHRLGSRGLYLEALPDDPKLEENPTKREEHRKHRKFYEYYGAYPIVGTTFKIPDDESPVLYLLFDPMGRAQPPARKECRTAVRLILQSKYGRFLSPEYIDRVVRSIEDDPVRLQERRFHEIQTPQRFPGNRLQRDMALISSSIHRIHHVRGQGYLERPARIEILEQVLTDTRLFDRIPCVPHGEKVLREVHDPDFLDYLMTVCEELAPAQPIYPYLFPIHRTDHKPKELLLQAGYYCIDTFTPLDQNAYRAARAAVDVALSAAEELLNGRPLTYALCRPPGHHAGRCVFGGFCYLNNAGAAAQRLSREGRVAVLDIDFHHGNGTQDIFWTRSEVFTLSIHGHPNGAYPYFSGFPDEIGEGLGRGCNKNFPLPEDAGDELYLKTLERALESIDKYRPEFVVLSLGYDTMAGDPTGSFSLSVRALQSIGSRLAELHRPLLIVQEGGYSLRNLRRGSAAFFRGISKTML